ncbi:hypothetical protein ABZW30_44865 [Kitasatospora sp. NPDC004669]|uniref:hypothetical protein n=1 Tax=Kitasatospora sp. NPDC004669 TaxID=3154555 RepID=UPI0033B5FA6C
MTMPEDSTPPRDTPPEPKAKPDPRPAASQPTPILGEWLRSAAHVVLVVVGLALTVLGFVQFADTFEEIRAYRATPVCTAAAKPGDDCVTLESGRVTNKEEEPSSDSTNYALTVTRETAPTGRYYVGRAFYDDVDTGTVVDLKILRGKVFELSYQGHRSQPPNTPYLTIVEFSVLIAVGLVMLVSGAVADIEYMVGIAIGYAAVVAFLTVMGSAFLITFQWPLTVTLALAVVFWLIAAAVTRTTFREF